MRLGPALADLPLVTAGSGVAIALPANFGIAPNPRASALPSPGGSRAVISGSCSRATNAQVAEFLATGLPALALDPIALCAGDAAIEHALDWARPKLGNAPILVYSTAAPESLRHVQDQLGVARAGELVERALARIACGLVQSGVGQLVIAGGETSGAVVQALGITQLQIGAQIDPGVPWCAAKSSVANGMLHVALKSGNFGTPDFFTKAFHRIA
jgi:uncharacterized protein YgbK (DUF1537 family)